MRRMVGPLRRPDEDYLSWIKRSTRSAEERASGAGCKCWLDQYLRSKWRWAGTLARMSDERWAKKFTFWRDACWQAENESTSNRPQRCRPGNRLRWEDDLRKYAAQAGMIQWSKSALDKDLWGTHEDTFASWAWR